MSSRTAAVGFGAFLLICAAAIPVTAQQKRPMTFQDLAAMHRLSGPQISPDGKWIAYEVGTPNLEANRVVRDIWLVSAEGGEARQITRGGSDTRPRWSPDGKRIAFLSSRDGEQQVYWITLDGGDANRLTSLSGGADTELWSPDGKWIAFVSSVYPDCKDEVCNCRTEGTARQKQSESENLRAFALSPLERLVGWHSQPPVRDAGRRRRGARSHAWRRLRCAAIQSGRSRRDCVFS